MEKEQVALELLKLAIENPNKQIKETLLFRDYNEFLAQYQKALRAISDPGMAPRD